MIQRLGWTLLHFLWQGTAIAVGYGVLRKLIGRSLSSELRYALACLALAAMAAAPILTFVLLPRGADAMTGELAIPWSLPTSAWQRIVPAFVAFWMAGVMAFSIRLFAGWRFTARLRFTAHPAPSEWQQTLERIAIRVRASRPVCLLVSSMVEVPTVIGWLKPAILLPVGALTGLPPEHIAALLAHEAAHIRRHDYLTVVLQSIVESVLFYHPAVWWISEQIRMERESCCDDLAVAASGDVATYVRALAGLESIQKPRMRHALAADGGSLVNRIRRLVDPGQARAENLPGPVAAWGMTLLWLAGIGVASLPAAVPAAQTRVQLPPVAIAGVTMTVTSGSSVPAVEDLSPAPTLPARATSLAGHARDTLMFDPFLSAQTSAQAAAASNPAPGGDIPGSTYSEWVNGDVAYIISAEERRAFLQLKSDDDREQFVQQFWLRRDPTPGTPENEYKEEHYRRIAYANSHFGWNDPGWKTDRGHVYIVFGPPDEIQAHSSKAAASAEETWRYRYIAGLGDDVRISFVDSAATGEFKIAPNQPDIFGIVAQATPNPGEAASSARPFANRLPMQVRCDYLRGTPASAIVNLTVQFEGRDLQFRPASGGGTAIVNLFGRLTSMSRRPISTFEPTLEVKTPQDRAEYQQSVPLAAGRYHLDVTAKDMTSGNVNNFTMLIDVPRFDEGRLTASSLILADAMDALPAAQPGGSMFAIGGVRVRPRVGEVFTRAEKMGVYLQAYNFMVDEKTRKPAGSIEYEIDSAWKNEKVMDVVEDVGTLPNASASQVTIQKLLPLSTLPPTTFPLGEYTLKVTVTDKIANQSVQRLERFKVNPE